MIQHLGTNSIFIFPGVPGRKGPVQIDTDLMMRNLVLKNQVVFGTVNAARETFEDSIRDLLLGKASGIKNVIQVNQGTKARRDSSQRSQRGSAATQERKPVPIFKLLKPLTEEELEPQNEPQGMLKPFDRERNKTFLNKGRV